MTVEAFAPAKVNLALHVTGRRADGYHLLDSLVVFADIGDRLRLTPSDSLSLSVTGPRAAGVPVAGNLVLRAAESVGAKARITLEKHLPMAAGIGGGSSDAAAALRALAEMGHALPDGLERLGADVPVCLLARAARMSGIGEAVAPIANMAPLPAVLVNPGVEIPTPEIFRRLRARDNPPLPEPIAPDALLPWLETTRNDLQPPAIEAAPIIGDVLSELMETGCALARMSGSGATCFGLYPTADAATQAAQALAEAQPGWWVQPTTLS